MSCQQEVEDKLVSAINEATQQVEQSMDVDGGEQQAASATAKRLKHLKDKVVPGKVVVWCVCEGGARGCTCVCLLGMA
jgi:hypothetical protein